MLRHKPIIFLIISLLLLILSFSCSPKHIGPVVKENGVTFFVNASAAKRVNIVGSFNQWDKDKSALSGPDSDGIWKITLPLLEERYEYLFLIDGEKWLLDPVMPSIDDGLGGRNSVIHIKK